LGQIITEATKMDYMVSNYLEPKEKEGKKIKPKLTFDEFKELLLADPETKLKGIGPETLTIKTLDKVKPGPYVNWIIQNYLNPETERQIGDSGFEKEFSEAKKTYIEDLSKITNDLKKFIRFKGRIEGERDLNKLTPSQLYDKVKDFSLEKTKATAQEKQEASKTYSHPGGDVMFRGNDWTVVRISDKSQLGKDAACFYGGYYMEPSKGETRWCTSGPGLTYFDRYIKDGPLYVVIPNTSTGQVGEKSGLPAERYQFHFPSNQFMDVHDRQIDLVKFLNGPMNELKHLFKSEFARGLTVGGEKLVIDNFNQGAVGKFVALYGLEELIESLPLTLKEFHIVNRDKNNDINIKIPESIGRFKNLFAILLENCVDSIPDSICDLKLLRFLALIDNPKLTSIPECVGDLPNLYFLNLKGTENVKIPESIQQKMVPMGNGMYDLEN